VTFSSHDIVAEPGECDGLPFSAEIAIGPYNVLVYSQDR
jgi:1,4-alpha-glucan branching enzyme